MNCAVGALLAGSLDFLMVILLATRTVQVQEISKNQPVQTVAEKIDQMIDAIPPFNQPTLPQIVRRLP